MPGPTYTLISTTTLTSSTLGVTFSSIPQTYRDLVLVIDGTSNSSEFIPYLINGNITGASANTVHTLGNGSAAQSTTSNPYGPYVSTSKFVIVSQFLDYSTTDKFKPILHRSDVAGDRTIMSFTRNNSTSAITSIKINDSYWSGATFLSGTVLSLYGIEG